ncbi:MAG: ComF family protein [Gammaproteobacteria bacterium]|nr:MAG: ComF family protein [Gammaproteobacteria bacterium]
MWSLFDRFLGSLSRCRLCGTAAHDTLCPACRDELPIIPHACRQCGLPLQGEDEKRLCGECLSRPPAFDAARIPFLYADPIDRLISALKFHERLSDGRLLGSLLAATLPQTAEIDLLLPIPLHRGRLRQRGFNQAAELARTLARVAHLPADYRALVRVQATAPQHRATRRQRLRQMREAFAWRGNGPPPPRVALVDDVVTTGATMDAAAACLKRAGAEWVEIWAVARTPRRD